MNGHEFVRLRMKTDTLAAEVIPELGGKVASLRHNGVDLLQSPLNPYAERSSTVGFDESDASGFDECVPSISACKIEGDIRIPDHGEFWRLACQAEQPADNEILLTAIGSILPLRFERRLKLQGGTLRVEYRLENTGTVEVPYLWSAHPLFAVDGGDIVSLPKSTARVCVEASAHKRLGAKGTQLYWPLADLKSGAKVDLSTTGDISEGVGDKLYTEAPPEGWAAVERKNLGLRIFVEFDAALTPYMGLWLCYGGWPEGRGLRQQCVALEPCTAPGDSLAEAVEKGWARKLAPGQADAWWMAITVTAGEQ